MNELQVDNLRNKNSGRELAGTVKMEVKEDDVLFYSRRGEFQVALCLREYCRLMVNCPDGGSTFFVCD